MNLQDLLEQLNDEKPAARREAIIALANLAGDEPSTRQTVLDVLADVYRSDPIPELRKLARKAGKHVTALDAPVVEETSPETAPPEAPPPTPPAEARASNALIQSRRPGDARPTSEQPIVPRPKPASSKALIPARRFSDVVDTMPDDAPPTVSRARILAGGVLIAVVLVALFVLLAVPRLNDAALRQTVQDRTRQLQSAAYGREYYLFIPEGEPPLGGFPAVLALHGNNQTGLDMIEAFGPISAQRRTMLIALNIDWQPNRLQNYLDQILADILQTVYRRDHAFNTSRGGPVLLGYGFGADYAAYFAAENADDFGGVLLLGIRPVEGDVIPLPARLDLPYRIASGSRDNAETFARDYATRLQGQGNPVIYTRIDNSGAELAPEQVRLLGEFLRELYGE